LLDDTKDKARDLGEVAKDGLGTAKDKASDLIDDVKDKFDGDEVTPTDKVEDGVNHSPGTDEDPSAGINEAVKNVILAAEKSVPPADAIDSPVGGNAQDLKADSDPA
jgi:hypothetical protein